MELLLNGMELLLNGMELLLNVYRVSRTWSSFRNRDRDDLSPAGRAIHLMLHDFLRTVDTAALVSNGQPSGRVGKVDEGGGGLGGHADDALISEQGVNGGSEVNKELLGFRVFEAVRMEFGLARRDNRINLDPLRLVMAVHCGVKSLSSVHFGGGGLV